MGLASLDPSNLSSYKNAPVGIDDSMSNFDHDNLDQQSEINQINYPRVNINSGNQNRMQNIQNQQQIINDHHTGMQSLVNVDERLDKDGNDWQHEKMALNRNVFNNQRRNAAAIHGS
jgi:uncharacterized protein YfaP (DUF2135 family)